MSTALMFDLIIVVIALFFIIQGWYRGLVLSLASLVVLICAGAGASIAADFLTPLATPVVTPSLESYLTNQIAEQAQTDPSATLASMLEDGKLSILTPYLDNEVIATAEASLSEFASETIADISNLVATGIIGTIIWVFAFLILALLLHIILHAVDLVAKLPVLNTLNTIGGILVGVVQSLLVIYIVLIVAGCFNWLPTEVEGAQSYVYHYFAAYNPLSLIA
ncbi:CvpA family protein [Bengtsoniella intestinalis]|uniref:CvpA family protein n=1 Tax=Bengtsoniella intestinalis TaxID=3073143 RepID=UPI00391EF89A